MKTDMFRTLGLSVALAAGLFIGQSQAQDQAAQQPADFPQRPINLIVMYPAGGAVDVTARTFAEVAEDQLGHSFRVENRVGGAGMVGHTYLSKTAEADGYTVGVIANPFLFTDILLRDAPFTKDEFVPVNSISFDPILWVVNADSEIGDMSFDEVVEHAEAGTLQVGMHPSSVFQFISELIERSKGLEFNYVPFDGGKAGVVALLAGDIDVAPAFYSEVEQYVQNGDLRPIAVSGDDRHPLLPDVPTLSEFDVPAVGQAWGATRIFTLPVGVPEDRKAYLEQAFLQVLQSEELAQAFEAAGLTLAPAGAEEAQASYEDSFETFRSFLAETGRLEN